MTGGQVMLCPSCRFCSSYEKIWHSWFEAKAPASDPAGPASPRPPTKATVPFQDRNGAVYYVTEALGSAIPVGWRIQRNKPELSWGVEGTAVPDGEWPHQDYWVHVTEDIQWIIITHGKKDCGFWTFRHELSNAVVISSASLSRYPLSVCLRFVFWHYRPNEWGYT